MFCPFPSLSATPIQHSLVSRLLAPLLSVFQLETTNLVTTLLTPSPTFPLTLFLQLLIFSLKICSAMQNQAYELTWDLSLLVGQQCNFLKILIWKVELNWKKKHVQPTRGRSIQPTLVGILEQMRWRNRGKVETTLDSWNGYWSLHHLATYWAAPV